MTGGYHKLEQDSLGDSLTLESLVMMNEVRNFSRPVNISLSDLSEASLWLPWLPVDGFHALSDAPGHGPGPAGEHANLTDVAVLLLHELQEGRHVRPTKVVDRLQSGEHRPEGNTK